MSQPEASLAKRCVAEVLGTFILVFFGCGAVHAAVLTGAQAGLWQVAVVWGVAIMVAAFLVGGVSGAHINPAVTVALAAFGGFPWRAVLPYVTAQLGGAFVAAALLHALFRPQLAAFEERNDVRKPPVKRGQEGSEVSAMCYGEFFPAPGGDNAELYRQKNYDRLRLLVPLQSAFIAEFVGTMILALVVFGFTDPRNPGRPLSGTAPVFIGLTVAILISVLAPLTQACFNPARDIGPRVFAATLGGWGSIALPGWNGWGFLLVYVGAPVLGAVAGGGLYQWVRAPEPMPDTSGRTA